MDTIKKTKCTFDGIIYKKGQRIQPDGTCFECICDEKLKTQDLDIYSSQCQRKQCGLGVSGAEHDYLDRGCVPVYDYILSWKYFDELHLLFQFLS